VLADTPKNLDWLTGVARARGGLVWVARRRDPMPAELDAAVQTLDRRRYRHRRPLWNRVDPVKCRAVTQRTHRVRTLVCRCRHRPDSTRNKRVAIRIRTPRDLGLRVHGTTPEDPVSELTTTINHADDVVSFLTNQHEQIKQLFEDVLVTHGDARQEAFTTLRRLLAVHETAEEEVVHPRAKHELGDGKRIVADRLEEEHEAKQTLATLEKLDVDSTEFETELRRFQADVVAHAEAEEREEFSKLAAELDDEQLARMRNAVKLAESTAPTRPHAGVESASTNMLVGPFASMLDRARDLITGKH
jgi:hemerythrin superfamily protein